MFLSFLIYFYIVLVGREKIVKTSWTLLFNLASLRQQPKLPQSPRKPSKSQSKTQSQQSNSQSQTQKQQPQQSKGNLKDKYPPLQTANEIAKIVGPRLIAKCKTLLQTFVLDERSGTTLDRSRVSEIVFILKQLDTLNISPVISLKRSGPKAHLLELFPVLCDCITTNETSLKLFLQKLFFHSVFLLSRSKRKQKSFRTINLLFLLYKLLFER